MMPIQQWRLLLVGALCLGAPIGAQSDVVRLQPERANGLPIYPETLRATRVGGQVRVRFVVDSAGRVQRAGFVVVEATHEHFGLAVRNAAFRWRFTPTRRAGRAVADTVEQRVDFVPPSSPVFDVVPDTVLRQAQSAPNSWQLAVGVPPVTPVASSVEASLQLPIATAALEVVLAQIALADSSAPPRVACIALGMTSPPAAPSEALLRALTRREIAAVAASRCPPTVASPVRVAGAESRPVDSPRADPWALNALAPTLLDNAHAVIVVSMSHATESGSYSCYVRRERVAQRAAPARWRAMCRAGRMVVH